MGLNQEAILLSLVQGDQGKAWVLSLEGWDRNFEDGVCSWEGIDCDPSDGINVIGINLRQRDLVASIPSEFGQLTTLRNIDLQRNLIYGTIPPEVAALPHLKNLILTKNQITGTLPAFSSPLLQTIGVGHNKLSGTIPDDIGEHERMVEFNVMHNQLTGTIPDSFSKAISLDMLALSDNRFSGTIPPNLGNAKVLRYLYLDNNFLMGTIPIGLTRIESPLAEIWLQDNLLSGTIPAAIADLENIFNFYVDGNKLTGTIPEELCREDINVDFYEDVPVNVDRNYCDSVSCPAGHVSEGIFPCVPCEDKHYNPYVGQIGQCIDLNQRDILRILYESTDGQNWTIKSQWNLNHENYCGFIGLTCDKNKNVVALDLKGKNLRGTIPEEIGFLQYLKILDLSNNHLTGFLPSDLRWAPLEKMDISGNQLVGIVPPMLCLKGNINGNGEQGEFGCEHIACPVGTYSATGIGSILSNRQRCVPCKGGTFLASKECAFVKEKMAYDEGLGNLEIFIILFMVALVLALTLVVMRKLLYRIQRRGMTAVPIDEL